MEEMEKTYPQYDDMGYNDLTTVLSNLERKVTGKSLYGKDPTKLVDLIDETEYVKKMLTEQLVAETTFTEGGDGTVNISGPSGNISAPELEFVEDPEGLLPDVLDLFNDTFEIEWYDIEDRLRKLKKFSRDRITAGKKRDFENQVERVQAVARVVKAKEKLVLDPRNTYLRELIRRSSVKTLKDGTEVLMFRSEQGINKSGTQIMKRGKLHTPVYSKNSPALREYKKLVSEIRKNPGPLVIRSDSNTSVYEDATEEMPKNTDGTPKSTLAETFEENFRRTHQIEKPEEPEVKDIEGLTPEENREMRGVLTSRSLEGRTGPNGALQIQADFLRETIRRTKAEAAKAMSLDEYMELKKRIEGLQEARERTLERKEDEEIEVLQSEDISRLKRFADWVGKEKVGLAGVAISTAGLITALLIHARGVVVRGARATGKVAKTLANLAKNVAPILVPVLNAIATALSWGAKGLTWLASNLWVLVLAVVIMVYEYYKPYNSHGGRQKRIR
ncbi:Hypothetical predicted protein [Paramuricea clavata]|uniref:Uncharacterized protein n=1 Tax=Paramuricea clavata TaxID=317549 RepID=A0A6S7FW51_PARCT|nr:Hypothetical predicted protein [Paramuricea clavata]